MNKGKTLIQNRRISVSFRDKSLLQVFGTGVSLLKELQSKIVSGTENAEVLNQALYHCLSLAHKSLNFEFIGVMLDDTLAESIGTHFPLTWRETMQDHENINAFFAIVMTPNLSEDTYNLCLQCLSELASCRISLFESFETRKAYVHNFATNLNALIKAQTEQFCSSRQVSKNYIKVFYKLEMNFQVRSFGSKDPGDISVLQEYLDNLSELTLYLIKSGEAYLREDAVHLLAAWNRVTQELKHGDMKEAQGCEKFINDKINTIIVEYIGQNISDMNGDNEDDDDEQFNETELSSLTQRFDIIGRLCNVQIESSFACIDEGLQFLMNRYEEELNKNNKEVMDIVETRFAWTLRVITALMNLGYAPSTLKNENFTGPGEYEVCIKVIELIRLNVQLSSDQGHKMNEKLELAILSFIQILRANVLADPRVVSKVLNPSIAEEDGGISKNEKYLKIAD